MRSRLWQIVIVAVVAVCAGGIPGQAAAKSTPLPDPIIIDTSEGRITLPHLAHAKKFHCNTCHSEVTPGKIAWDTETAHAYCRDCHKKNAKGPVTCAECHKK